MKMPCRKIVAFAVMLGLLLSLASPAEPAAAASSEINGSQNSSGTYPNIVGVNGKLYYINAASRTEDGNNLYRIDRDGSNRTAILTLEQATREYRKTRKGAIVLQPQNLLYAKEGRLYFICQTRELVAGKGKEEFHGEYIFSVDLSGKDLKMVRELVKPGDEAVFSDWRIANYENLASYMKVRGFRPPVAEGGWQFLLEDGKIIRQKPDGSGKAVVTADPEIDRFTVSGGWVYYDKKQQNGIFRITVYGENLSRLGDTDNFFHGLSGFTVAGDWLYYLGEDKNTLVNSLHRIRTDGSEDVEIKTVFHPFSFQIINGLIFYNTIEISKTFNNGSVMYGNNWNLRVMNLDGTGDRAIDTAAVLPPPSPAPEPTRAPQYGDGLDNSTGAFPHIVRAGTELYYINGEWDTGLTLYRMGLDGTQRTAVLTNQQAFGLFKKLKSNAVRLDPQNVLYVKDKRIFFATMATEIMGDRNKDVMYIMSIDLAMKDLKIEKQLKDPKDQGEFHSWYARNSFVYMGTGKLVGARPPIIQDGWMYYTRTDDNPYYKVLYKARLDGSEETPVHNLDPVDRFIVQGEWIYFERLSTAGIWRISVNGGEAIMIGGENNIDHKFSGFVVFGDWIYFNEKDVLKGEYSLHRLKTDGSENIRIDTKYSPYSFQIINNLIFYNTIDSTNSKGSWNLRVMNLDGTGDRAIDAPAED